MGLHPTLGCYSVLGFPLFPSLATIQPMVFHFFPPLAVIPPWACIRQVRVQKSWFKDTYLPLGRFSAVSPAWPCLRRMPPSVPPAVRLAWPQQPPRTPDRRR